MAKIKGLSPSKMAGSVGDFTYRQTKFGTVVSEKIQKGRKLPSLRQCRARYQMTNLTNFGAALLPAIRKGFKGMVNNEVPAFVRANYGMHPVYIPKYLAEAGAAIVVPCQLTSGTLVPVSNTLDTNNKVVSNIAVGNLSIGASTTIAELSAAIIAANIDWRDGDQLSLVVATQKVTSSSMRSIPSVKVDMYEVILGSSSSLLSTVIPATLLSTSNGMLSMASALVNQGAAFVHSRTEKGETYVSTAFMVANNAETISAYNTTPALIATANTYGGYREGDFLESTSESSHTAGPGTGDADSSNPGGQGGGSSESFAVTINGSLNGSVTVTRVDNGATVNSGSSVAAGTQLRFQANPSAGYVFSKWSDDNTSNPRIVVVNEAITLGATFSANAGSGGGGGDDDDDIG